MITSDDIGRFNAAAEKLGLKRRAEQDGRFVFVVHTTGRYAVHPHHFAQTVVDMEQRAAAAQESDPSVPPPAGPAER